MKHQIDTISFTHEDFDAVCNKIVDFLNHNNIDKPLGYLAMKAICESLEKEEGFELIPIQKIHEV